MKILDRNGRLFGKISIIDLLVVAMVVLLGLGLYVKTSDNTVTAFSDNKPIVYQVTFHNLRNYVADAIHEGDLLYDDDKPDTGGSLGKITKVERLPASILMEFDDGTVVEETPADDSCNVVITVEGSGSIDGKTYKLNRVYPLGINSNRNLCTKYVMCTGVISAILS